MKTDKPKDDVIPLTFSKVQTILHILLDKTQFPVYIHCLDGIVVTGMVCACLRRVIGWSTTSSLTEYARYLADGKSKYQILYIYIIDGGQSASIEETEFLEKFTCDLVLSRQTTHVKPI